MRASDLGPSENQASSNQANIAVISVFPTRMPIKELGNPYVRASTHSDWFSTDRLSAHFCLRIESLCKIDGENASFTARRALPFPL